MICSRWVSSTIGGELSSLCLRLPPPYKKGAIEWGGSGEADEIPESTDEESSAIGERHADAITSTGIGNGALRRQAPLEQLGRNLGVGLAQKQFTYNIFI